MSTPIDILLVEDNPGDVRLTQEHLKDAGLLVRVTVVDNGDDVLPYLRREGDFAAATRPDIVLLDLNLPGKDGRDVLREIRADARLKGIAVVVLTSSRLEDDLVRAFDHDANLVHKPVEVDELKHVIGYPDDFWVTARKPEL